MVKVADILTLTWKRLIKPEQSISVQKSDVQKVRCTILKRLSIPGKLQS